SVSRAAYPGVASLYILGNVIPTISGEEEKIESETQKILGSFAEERGTAHSVAISAKPTRGPAVDGHTESISIGFDTQVSPDEVKARLSEFRGRPQALALPSAPAAPIVCAVRPDRPQPRFDA